MERDPHDPNTVQRVMVRYNICCLHDYSASLLLPLDYPDLPGGEDDMNRLGWPGGYAPHYHPPSNYINEMTRRDLCGVDNQAFRGGRAREVAERILESVQTWDPLRF